MVVAQCIEYQPGLRLCNARGQAGGRYIGTLVSLYIRIICTRSVILLCCLQKPFIKPRQRRAVRHLRQLIVSIPGDRLVIVVGIRGRRIGKGALVLLIRLVRHGIHRAQFDGNDLTRRRIPVIDTLPQFARLLHSGGQSLYRQQRRRHHQRQQPSYHTLFHMSLLLSLSPRGLCPARRYTLQSLYHGPFPFTRKSFPAVYTKFSTRLCGI